MNYNVTAVEDFNEISVIMFIYIKAMSIRQIILVTVRDSRMKYFQFFFFIIPGLYYSSYRLLKWLLKEYMVT